MGLPTRTRFVRAQGAAKSTPGQLDVPVVVRRRRDPAGDNIVVQMDCDGAMALPVQRAADVLPLAVEREAHERAMRERDAAGELS